MLLTEALRNVDVPGFGAVIFRKNANQVLAQGGLWDTSRALYAGLGQMRLTPSPRLDISVGREDFICVSGGRRGGAEVAGQSDCPYLL